MNGRQAGFTYLWILFAVAFAGVAAAATGMSWSLSSRREKERELLFVGHEIRQAIARYYAAGPAGVRQYPRSLDDLVADRRAQVVQRHLRRIYRDPMTLEPDWELILSPDGSVIGVASRSDDRPLNQSSFADEDAGFEGSDCYCDWRFVYLPDLVPGQRPRPAL